MKSTLPSLLISIPEGVIDLGWGHPSPRLHPLDELRKAVDLVLSEGQVTALQYGATQGFGPLLESLAAFLSEQDAYGCSVTPEQLFLGSGSSQAIDLATTLFTRNGETVFVEEPTYYLIQRIFEDHHLKVVGVPTDESGLSMDALEDMLNDKSINNPKLLYIIPTFQNPTGAVLPAERRRKLVELAQQFEFKILADEVYQLLYYGSPPPSPIVAYDNSDPGCVISLGSFSKILAPGLRLGWVHAHPDIIKRFNEAGMTASGGGLNHFTSNLVHATLELGLLQDNINKLKAVYSRRVESMTKTLRSCYPERFDFTPPRGGYFFWLTCRDDVSTDKLLPIAQEAGVSYRPGTAFSAAGAFSDSLRLSFALYESDELNEGLSRLVSALDEYHSL